jgi:TonB-dependent receptor
MYDIRDYDNYSYDYSQNQNLPTLRYDGVDVTDPTNFTLTDLRDAIANTRNTFDTAELKLFWEVMTQLRIATGATFKRMTHDTWQKNRDGSVCGLKHADGTPLSDECTPGALGLKGTRELSHTTNYPGEVGAGSKTSWASASYDEWVNRLNYYDVPLNPDKGRTRKVQETNFGGFLQLDGEFGFGSGMRLNYNAGLQYVQTRQKSAAYVGNDWTDDTRDPYGDFLKSGNLAFWPIENLVVRASAAQVMARPLLTNLAPGATVDSYQFRINYQNTNLEPTRANAFDASLEWYFQKESVLSLAVFRKDIKSFPLPTAHTGTYAGTNLPTSLIAKTSSADLNNEGTCGKPEGCWEITQLENGPGATINGLELGFQAPFSAFYAHLPPVIRGLGVIANVTLVDSKTPYTYSEGNQVEEKLGGLSAQAYNATLYYDSPKFGIRASVAHRSAYLDPNAATNINGNLFQYTEANTRIDASSKYKIIDQLEVTVEALNLLNSPEQTTVNTDAPRMVTYRKTGRNFLLGARYTY